MKKERSIERLLWGPLQWRRPFAFVWKWTVCRWLHKRHQCFPDVGGLGLEGCWHCGKCHPCGEGFSLQLREMERVYGDNPPWKQHGNPDRSEER